MKVFTLAALIALVISGCGSSSPTKQSSAAHPTTDAIPPDPAGSNVSKQPTTSDAGSSTTPASEASPTSTSTPVRASSSKSGSGSTTTSAASKLKLEKQEAEEAHCAAGSEGNRAYEEACDGTAKREAEATIPTLTPKEEAEAKREAKKQEREAKEHPGTSGSNY
jgi:hypothetical protein